MSRSLLDLSGNIEDPRLVEIFSILTSRANEGGIHYFVVGATARDLIFACGHGIASGRATLDIDLAIELSGWDAFHALKEALIESGFFEPTRMVQRLIYGGSMPLDIVPFGLLEQGSGEIRWPPDEKIRMNMRGFEDAYRDAQMVRLRAKPVLDIPCASPAGLALLKIIAWNDRWPAGGKDAGDLLFLMRNFLEAGKQDDLYHCHPDLLEGEDFDFELASARLLGRDIAKIMSDGTRGIVVQILERETSEQGGFRLLTDMAHSLPRTDQAFEQALRLLDALRMGVEEGGW